MSTDFDRGTTDFPHDPDADDSLRGRVKEAADQLKAKASSGADAAKEHAKSFVAENQGTIAAGVDKVSGAIRAAADNLSTDGAYPKISGLLQDAADGVQKLASSLENKSPEEMVRTATDFARRQPALFVAGAVLLGVVAGRFVRASAPDDAKQPSQSM